MSDHYQISRLVQTKECFEPFPKPDVTSLTSGGELFERFLDSEFAPKEPEINGFVKQANSYFYFNRFKGLHAIHTLDIFTHIIAIKR
jgi:hypothetical protein